jgi:Protein of unknown function (DUF3606)
MPFGNARCSLADMARTTRRKRGFVVAVLPTGIDVTAKNPRKKKLLHKLRGAVRKPPRRADGTPSEVLRHTPKGFPMADDLKQTGKPDDARINVDQDHELNYWSEKLGVSRDELRKAVHDAGPMVKDVQRHLGR